MKTFSHLWQYLAEFFLEWEIFQINFAGKIKKHSSCSVTFFRKSCRLWHNVDKYGGARETVEDNITARYMLDNWGYMRASTRPSPCTLTLTNTNTHTRTRLRARGHTHTHLLLSHGKKLFRKRASVLRCSALPVFLMF